MDKSTAKAINASNLGQAALNAALIALLIQKEILTLDEVTAMLDGYQRELAKSETPESTALIEAVLQIVQKHFEQSSTKPCPKGN